MTPDRAVPQTVDEMWVNVLHAVEMLAAAANDQRISIENLKKRTKRRDIVLLCVVVLLQFVTIVVLRDGQRQIESCINSSGECAKRGAAATAEAVQALQCLDVLLHGQRPAICEPERVRLEAAGVVLP